MTVGRLRPMLHIKTSYCMICDIACVPWRANDRDDTTMGLQCCRSSWALTLALHAADRCGGRCGGTPQAGVQNACGHMYLDQGEEMNLERNLNNYLTMASQVVRQVRCLPAPVTGFA